MDARTHADAWLAAWNAHDLEAVLACYADDVNFIASTVADRWDRPDGQLHGVTEPRKHFALGLRLAPDLTMTEDALLTSPDTRTGRGVRSACSSSSSGDSGPGGEPDPADAGLRHAEVVA